ncbi:MAG: LytR C-terminal domain-containing protein [Actinomycetota bacterium]
MSRKKVEEENGAGVEGKAPLSEKEKLSRLNKRHQKEARKKRRVLLVVVLLALCVLAVGAILDIPYINVAREAGSWIGDRFASPDDGEEDAPEYLFFTDPQSAGEFEGEVSVLLGVYTGTGAQAERELIYLMLYTYDRDTGGGEAYLVPESSVAYNASGQQVDLARTLREEGGEDLLRSTVSNIAGTEVDYLLLVEFWEAVRLLQGLGPPAAVLAENTVFVNPVNGETNFLVAGQEVKDADRLLFYLMATDRSDTWAAFDARGERAGTYLPEFFYALQPYGLEELGGMLSSLGDGYLLDPGTGSATGDSDYIASMLQAFAGLDGGALAIKAVPAVEVLNGCGVPDLGKKVGDRLNSLGVPVAGTGGNAKVTVDGEEINDFTHEVSTIIYRSVDPRAEAFARYLGVLLTVTDVVSEPGPGPEIILIAGRDLAV